MKEKMMIGAIIFLLLVIVADAYVLLDNINKPETNTTTINDYEIREEINKLKEDNVEKIERYNEVDSWNREIIDYLK